MTDIQGGGLFLNLKRVSSCEGLFSLIKIWHLGVSRMKKYDGRYWLGLRVGVIMKGYSII